MILFSYTRKKYGDGHTLPEEGDKTTIRIPISVFFIILFIIGCFLGAVIMI